MIATSPAVGYIREPFGLGRRPGLCGAQFKHWFTYISSENEKDFYEDIKRTLEFRFNGRGRWHSVRSPRAVAGTVKIYLDFLKYRMACARPLLKDPLAVFSADWLAEKFDMDVLVLIRHPAGFVSSLKLLNWQIPFKDLLDQPFLIRDRLYPFEAEIRKFAYEERDIVDQAAFFWKMTYYVVLKYREQNPNWIFVRHDDLSRDPLTGFRALFRRLNLDFSQQNEKVITEHSMARDALDKTIVSSDSIKRNSLSNLSHWKTRLTRSEIARVQTQVQDISRHFYSDQEW